MKKSITLLIVLLLSFGMLSFSESDPIVGAWHPTAVFMNGEKVSARAQSVIAMTNTYEFTDHGTVIITTAEAGNYRFSEDSFIFSYINSDLQDFINENASALSPELWEEITERNTVLHSCQYALIDDSLILNKGYGDLALYEIYRKADEAEGLEGKWIAVTNVNEKGLKEYLSNPDWEKYLAPGFIFEYFIILNSDGTYERGLTQDLTEYITQDDIMTWTSSLLDETEKRIDFEYRFDDTYLVLAFDSSFNKINNDGNISFQEVTAHFEVYFERDV